MSHGLGSDPDAERTLGALPHASVSVASGGGTLTILKAVPGNYPSICQRGILELPRLDETKLNSHQPVQAPAASSAALHQLPVGIAALVPAGWQMSNSAGNGS